MKWLLAITCKYMESITMRSDSAPPSPQGLSPTLGSGFLEAPQELTPEEETQAPGAGQRVSLTTSPRLRLFALCINILVLAELFVAMFFASQQPDSLTPVFFKTFFCMLAPTLVAALVGRRIITKAER